MGCATLLVIGRDIYTPKHIESIQYSPIAVAVHGNKIIGVGNLHDIRAKICATTKIIKSEKGTILPGFIDAHTHMIDMGWRGSWIDLSGVKKLKDLLNLLSDLAQRVKEGEWILGHSWDESSWEDEKRYPTIRELNEVSTRNPIYLRRIDGHMAIVNSKALEELKIPSDIPIIEKDKKGKPTGVIKEKALEFAEKKIKKMYRDIERAIEYAFSKSIEKGVTSVTDYLTPRQLVLLSNYLAKKPKLYRVASYIWIEFLDEISEFNMKMIHGSSFLRFKGVKLMVDGSIGARTAALREPYRDDPSNRGTLFYSEEELEEIVRKIESLGYQLSIHAIGDRAIDGTLSALKSSKKLRLLRHRIEHFEIVQEEHIEIVKREGIYISMQPNFVANWQHPGGLYDKRLGWDRAKNMNPFKTILDSKIKLGFGSDCMPFDPLYGIYGALTHPKEDEKLSLEEAISAYTIGSAQLEGSEAIKGSLEKGKLADIIVLDGILDESYPKKLMDMKVKYTIVNGSYIA